MNQDLEKLTAFINKEYYSMNELWKKQILFGKLHLKRTLVKDIVKEGVLVTILAYRAFIGAFSVELIENLQKFNTEHSNISARVKTINSVMYKIDNYLENHEKGEIPLIKCMNDLFGIRMICNDRIEYNEVKRFIQENYPKLKCLDSSKGEYVATHIYFQDGNEMFPWELQVWCKEDEIKNKESHAKYKQYYTKWESKIKGGVTK